MQELEKHYLREIDKCLRKIFDEYKATVKDKVAVMVSGGIDSSVVAWWVKKSFSDFELFGLVKEDGEEKKFLEILGTFLERKINFVYWEERGERGIKEDLGRVRRVLEKGGVEINKMQVSLALACFWVYEEIVKQGIKVVFSGQGPDVLLGGYFKYKKVEDLNKEILGDLERLEIDRKRETVVADLFGLKVEYPFLKEDFIKLSLEIPVNFKIREGREKYILRKYGERLGLPGEIVERPKKAFQYSSGVQKLVNKFKDCI